MIWFIKKCDIISENIEILSEKARDKLINLKKELRWGSVIITLIETYFSFVLDTFKFFKKVQLKILTIGQSYGVWIKLPIILAMPGGMFSFLYVNRRR